MDLKDIYQNVIDGQAPAVEAGVNAALAEGIPADEILKGGLIAAMDEVGRQFSAGVFFVPEMLMAAEAMQAGLDVGHAGIGGAERREGGGAGLEGQVAQCGARLDPARGGQLHHLSGAPGKLCAERAFIDVLDVDDIHVGMHD